MKYLSKSSAITLEMFRTFLKSKISYGSHSNQKIDAFLKVKIFYGAQSNQKIEALKKNEDFLQRTE